MKNIFTLMMAIVLMACSNNGNNAAGSPGSDSSGSNPKEQSATGSSGGDCASNILFTEGTVMLTSSYDGQGKETSKQSSLVKKVYKQGGMSFSEMEIKTTDAKGGDEKTMNAVYKCDGKQFYVDLSSFLSENKQDMQIETSGLLFPYKPTVGEALPDANYSMNLTSAGKTTKITSHIKERKVEVKESVTTPAGTFDCYRISSVVEAEVDIPGLDEQTKQAMEKVKQQMGKTKMIFWYSPEATIIKMELYMGEKLMSRSEVTGIKK